MWILTLLGPLVLQKSFPTQLSQLPFSQLHLPGMLDEAFCRHILWSIQNVHKLLTASVLIILSPCVQGQHILLASCYFLGFTIWVFFPSFSVFWTSKTVMCQSWDPGHYVNYLSRCCNKILSKTTLERKGFMVPEYSRSILPSKLWQQEQGRLVTCPQLGRWEPWCACSQVTTLFFPPLIQSWTQGILSLIFRKGLPPQLN